MSCQLVARRVGLPNNNGKDRIPEKQRPSGKMILVRQDKSSYLTGSMVRGSRPWWLTALCPQQPNQTGFETEIL